jgi:hypothetical protein
MTSVGLEIQAIEIFRKYTPKWIRRVREALEGYRPGKGGVYNAWERRYKHTARNLARLIDEVEDLEDGLTQSQDYQD